MENPSNPSPEETFFSQTVLEIFTPTLAKYGFTIQSSIIRQYSSKHVFKKDQRYVEISSTTYCTDYPYFYDVILGEPNSMNFPISLWNLQSETDNTSDYQSEYSFPYGDEVRISVSNANKALLKYAQPFLLGDPEFLNEVNARLYSNKPKDDFLPWPFKTRRQS